MSDKISKKEDRARDLIVKVLSHFWDLYDAGLIDRARLERLLALI